jgi:hypothetical protein
MAIETCIEALAVSIELIGGEHQIASDAVRETRSWMRWTMVTTW